MGILTKFCSTSKVKPPRSALPQPPRPAEELHMPLRIVQAGGLVECYYMALPAEYIMKKYPRSVLARPEVFRRPWDSIVKPDEILTPGEKFFVVPRSTVRKLRRRFRRPSPIQSIPGEESDSDFSSKVSRNSSNTTKSSGPDRLPGSKKLQFTDMWQPSLLAIDE